MDLISELECDSSVSHGERLYDSSDILLKSLRVTARFIPKLELPTTKLRPTSFPEMSKNSLIMLIPSYRQILLFQILKSSIILSFDSLAFELKPFHGMCAISCSLDDCAWMINSNRPVNEVEDKVKPCNLLEYCEQHHFRAPGCLCPLLQKLGNREELIFETAILEKISGTCCNHIVEYVMECASGHCGYSGVFLLRLENC